MDEAFVGALARVILRYGSGAGVAIGLWAPDVAEAVRTDPDFLAVLSFVLGTLAEYYWMRSRRRAPGPR